MENRLYARFKPGYKLKTECDIADKVKIKDISIGGICLETPQQIDTSKVYKIKLNTNKYEKINLNGEVVRSSIREVKVYKGHILPVYETGLLFIEQNSNKMNFLKKLTRTFSQ
jgi:hypothetical protein